VNEVAEPAVRTGPAVVRLLGRDGVGRRTLAAALRRRGVTVGCPDEGPGLDADIHLYCFTGGLRAADRVALDRLADRPQARHVAWCQADLAGSWRAADARAAELADLTGCPLTPVMAALDRPLAVADLRGLRELAAAGIRLDTGSPTLTERLGEHADLLQLLGGYGLGCAVGALRQWPELPDAQLSARLGELSGVDELVRAIIPNPARLTCIRAAAVDARWAELLVRVPALRDRAEARLLRPRS
jgi:hypothetical protein